MSLNPPNASPSNGDNNNNNLNNNNNDEKNLNNNNSLSKNRRGKQPVMAEPNNCHRCTQLLNSDRHLPDECDHHRTRPGPCNNCRAAGVNCQSTSQPLIRSRYGHGGSQPAARQSRPPPLAPSDAELSFLAGQRAAAELDMARSRHIMEMTGGMPPDTAIQQSFQPPYHQQYQQPYQQPFQPPYQQQYQHPYQPPYHQQYQQQYQQPPLRPSHYDPRPHGQLSGGVSASREPSIAADNRSTQQGGRSGGRKRRRTPSPPEEPNPRSVASNKHKKKAKPAADDGTAGPALRAAVCGPISRGKECHRGDACYFAHDRRQGITFRNVFCTRYDAGDCRRRNCHFLHDERRNGRDAEQESHHPDQHDLSATDDRDVTPFTAHPAANVHGRGDSTAPSRSGLSVFQHLQAMDPASRQRAEESFVRQLEQMGAACDTANLQPNDADLRAQNAQQPGTSRALTPVPDPWQHRPEMLPQDAAVVQERAEQASRTIPSAAPLMAGPNLDRSPFSSSVPLRPAPAMPGQGTALHHQETSPAEVKEESEDHRTCTIKTE
ncbi:hypothetical protein B0A50_04724 [Salinomyces thailandicus]|uniref:C3H1-type domain-containing protein n=1 Tax=Salinomyces thailandicus TaxID=706561 RepID=A0A4U0TXA4_9PEZI|nr:hypothetical protein B0A50_04724 [Salinomyces thailandica]